MQTTTDHPFSPDNKAYRRFRELIGEHLDVSEWRRDADDRLVMISLQDLASGDTFTIAIMDSLEHDEPHALIVVNDQCEVTAHGAFNGGQAAGNYAPQLALSDSTVIATRPVPLHRPEVAALPDDAWLAMPAEYAEAAHPALLSVPAAVLILIDRHLHVQTTVGPFPNHAAATDWPLPAGIDPDIARLVVALLPAADHTA